MTAVLLRLVFNTNAVGVSPVSISVTAIGDENGIPLSPVDLNNGVIRVIDSSGPPIPEPSTLLLLASGAGLLLRRHRRV
jgi:hypothetical protein